MQSSTETIKPDSSGARRKQLISPDELQKLTRRSDRKGIVRLGQHFMALLVLGYLMTVMPVNYVWIPGLMYSAFLIFSFCPLHESIHGSLFATRRINQISSFILGLLIVLPPKYFHAFHMAHHRYTQLPEKDPELLTPKPKTLKGFLWIVSGVPYVLSEAKVIFRGALGFTDDFVPQRQQLGIIWEARVFMVVYAIILAISVWTQSLVFVWFWLLPLLVGQPLLRLFLMAEHTGCDEVEDMLRNSRTTYSNRLMTWFCWHMNHHTAHHAYAGVPFFRLKQVTELLAPDISVAEYGYISVNRRIISQLNLSSRNRPDH